MQPRTWPSVDGVWQVFEVSPTGLVEGVDYIPVQTLGDPPAAGRLRYDDNGWMPINPLSSASGLVAWIDYTPVDFVTGRSGPWKNYIPVAEDA